MNLLAVSTWLPYPPDNGSRLRAYQLIRQLARRHTLTLLAFGEPRAPADLDALRALCGHVEVVPPTPLNGGRLGMRGLLSPVPRYFLQIDSVQMRSLVSAQVDRHDAAIALQVNAARYLSGCPGVPRVFEEVEVGTYRDAPPAETSPLRRIRRRVTWSKYGRFVRRLVGEFDRSTVVSRSRARPSHRDRLRPGPGGGRAQWGRRRRGAAAPHTGRRPADLPGFRHVLGEPRRRPLLRARGVSTRAARAPRRHLRRDGFDRRR